MFSEVRVQLSKISVLWFSLVADVHFLHSGSCGPIAFSLQSNPPDLELSGKRARVPFKWSKHCIRERTLEMISTSPSARIN